MFSISYLRSFKILGFAAFDLTLSFLGIYLLAPLLTKLFLLIRLHIPRSSWLLLTLPLSILVHVMVGQYTPFTKYFLDPSGHYLLKLLILVLIILGFAGIHKV